MSNLDELLLKLLGTNDEVITSFIKDVKRKSKDISDFEMRMNTMDVGLSSEAIKEVYRASDYKSYNDSSDEVAVMNRVSKLLKSTVGIDDQVVVEFLLNIINRVSTESAFCQELDKMECGVPQSVASDIYQIVSGDNKINVEQEKTEGLIPLNTSIKQEDFSGKKNLLPGKNPFLDQRDIKPILNKIYHGKVKNVTTFGCFVQIYGTQEKNCNGLVHISELAKFRVRSPWDVVQPGQGVFVKVIDLRRNGNISLSMKRVDQFTGREMNTSDSADEIRGRKDKEEHQYRAPRKPLTSPERWEIRQLIASGAASAEDYPELNQPKTNNVADTGERKQQEERVDVELNIEDEPTFLKGETDKGGPVNEQPAKNTRIQKGTMTRAASNGSKLMKAHREEKARLKKEIEKRIQQRQALDDPTVDTASKKRETDQLRQQVVLSAWEKSRMKEDLAFGKKTTLSLSDQRKSLPVYDMRKELIQAIKDNQFIVIVGETGSGKTTQITQYLHEVGISECGMVGCTQPRRVAAISVAQRVAEEVGCKVGEEVGYTIRFEDRTSKDTRIKYMTDGMLQTEALSDPKMSRYSVIMLDEAHERTVATDVLFALLKQAASQRPDLKVIVTSATLDSAKFSEYFHNCPIKHIPGKTYPVEVVYSLEPQLDYLESALDCVMQIHVNEGAGDILVFLTGQEEIDSCCEILYQRIKTLKDSIAELIILPVYSALPSEIQSKIFEPTPVGSRKVVFATNIAETSITIDGIRYVVDPGFAKINTYNPRMGMEQLIISPISQAQANQRTGRAGRTGPGKCYRLYTVSSYRNEMLPNAIPEIQRQNLSHTILLLKAMGVNDLLNFDFMDPPPRNLLIQALEELFNLQALDEEGHLTKLGYRMSQFPTEPTLSRTLLSSVSNNCSEEIITVISMLSIPGVFYRPKDKQKDADNKKARFHHPYGDHLTLLNVFQRWQLAHCSEQFCSLNYLQYRHLRHARDVKNQLITIFRRLNLPIVSCRGDYDIIRKTVVSGFFMNAAKRDPQVGYKTISGETPVTIHPSSSLYGKEHEYVVYHSLLLTTKEYMSQVTVINSDWLLEAAPHFYKIADESKKRAKITPMFQRPNHKRVRR